MTILTKSLWIKKPIDGGFQIFYQDKLVLTAVYVGFFSLVEGDPHHYYISVPSENLYPFVKVKVQNHLTIEKIEAQVDSLVDMIMDPDSHIDW